MAELYVQTPDLGLELPLERGRVRLSALPSVSITAIQPFPGQTAAVDAVLRPLGLRFPVPGESVATAGARLVWAGRETAFLFGAPAPDGLRAHAACTDQSDGWAGLRLDGSDAEAVLARLVPIDLRAGLFGVGACARTPLNHMQALILRAADETFDLHVFRSMAATAVHDLADAMRAVAARQARP